MAILAWMLKCCVESSPTAAASWFPKGRANRIFHQLDALVGVRAVSHDVPEADDLVHLFRFNVGKDASSASALA